MHLYHTITATIGRTPMVKLNRLADGLPAPVLAKLEYFNPLGSVKDRIAAAMINEAELSGKIGPEYIDRRAHQRQYGHRPGLCLCRQGVSSLFDHAGNHEHGAKEASCPPGSRGDFDARCRRYAGGHRQSRRASIPTRGCIICPTNSKIRPIPLPIVKPRLVKFGKIPRERWTSWSAAWAPAAPSPGSAGLSKRKNRISKPSPWNRPVHPCFQGVRKAPHKIQGIGAGFIPKVLDRSVIDEVITVPDDAAFDMARHLAASEGLLCGISSGAAVWAALQVARRIRE